MQNAPNSKKWKDWKWKKRAQALSFSGKYELREELKCKAGTLSRMNKAVEEWRTMIH